MSKIDKIMPFEFNNPNKLFNADGTRKNNYSPFGVNNNSNPMFIDGNVNPNYTLAPKSEKTFGFQNNNYNLNDASTWSKVQDTNENTSKSPSQMGALYALGALGNLSPMQGNMEYYGNNLGRGLENKNAGQIIGGGLGMALSGVKSIMAGSGAANIQNFLQKEGMRKYRQAIDDVYGQENLSNLNTMRTQGYYADGGQMPQEQQITPEMIIQAYAQMQGMNEQQMGQLMQELQNLSPEEQQQAIQEMAQAVQQAQQQMAQEQAQAPQEEMPQEQMAPEGEPMMSYGGKIGLYAGGGEYVPNTFLPTPDPNLAGYEYDPTLVPGTFETNVTPVKNNYVYKNAQGNLIGYSTDQNPNMNKDVILDSSQVQNNKYIYKDKNGNVIGIGNENTMYGKEGNRRVGMPIYGKGGMKKCAEGGMMNEMEDEMMEEKNEMLKLSIRKDKKGTQIIVEKEETPVRRQDVIDFKRWLNDNGMNVKIDGKLDAALLNKAEQAGMSFEMFKEKKSMMEENMKMHGGRIQDNMVSYKPVFKKK